jgi:hypothetical protein
LQVFRQPHLEPEDLQREVGLLQQLLAVLRVFGSYQGLQQVVDVAFDAFSQHKTVVPRKFAGVVAGPEYQVIGLGDYGQFLGFFIDF